MWIRPRGELMEPKRIDVVAMGELLIDFAALRTDPEGYPTMAAHPGGAPCNFLAALSRYGVETAFLGKVGSDTFGELLVKSLSACGIHTEGVVRDPSVFTTLAFVTLDSTGDRHFSFARKPGADTRLLFSECRLELMDQAKIFHFGTLSLTDEPAAETTRALVAYAKRRGQLISFDPNLRLPLWPDTDRAREAILWGLAQADIVKISDEEVAFLWNCGPEEGAEKLLREFGVKLVFVTLGPRGAYFANANGAGYARTIAVKPVDTTGAGDIFGGSAVGQILKTGKRPEDLTGPELTEIASFASAAASLSTCVYGGLSSVPAYETVVRHMRQ